MSQVREVNRLGALNLRQETTKLEEYEFVKLVNFDVARKPGTLALRRGRDFLYSVNTAEVVRQVAKINGTRYQVAGDQLYRDGTAITRDLSTENETNFQAFRPLDDTRIWAFIADDNLMIKDSGNEDPPKGEDLFLWGIDLIPLPAPKLANQTGKDPTDTIDAGVYKIAVTQIRWDVSEGEQLVLI
jgi:hypothetical protein